METLYFKSIRELQKNKRLLEQKLQVTLELTGKQVRFEGTAVQEYEARIVLEALQFGFSAKKALQLLEEDMMFKQLHIKEFTRRKNMEEVRARVIGREGKTKRAIENITNCTIIIKDTNEIGIIGTTTDVSHAVVGLGNLIRGTKEGNAYAFLERMNAETKKHRSDLGLKDEDNNKNINQTTDSESDEEDDA